MLNSIHLYRIARWLYLKKLSIVSKMIELLIFLIYNSRIPSSCKIGDGTYLGYGGIGVVIHARAEIGDNVSSGSNVTIGGRSGHFDVPKIGNNVEIATGAKILGPIAIGNNVVIGANAVVISDVEANWVVVGIPAKKLKRTEVYKKELGARRLECHAKSTAFRHNQPG